METSYYEGIFRAQEEQISYLARLLDKLREEYEAHLEEKEAETDRLRNMAWTNGDILKESQAEAAKLRAEVAHLRAALTQSIMALEGYLPGQTLDDALKNRIIDAGRVALAR